MTAIEVDDSQHSEVTSETVSAIVTAKGSADEQLLHALETEEALAEVLARQGKRKEAEKMLRETWRTREIVLGQTVKDLELRRLMNNLTSMLEHGLLIEREMLMRSVLEGDKMALGEEDVGTIVSMNNLANIWCQQGKYNEAEELMRHAVELSKKVRGADHPETVSLLDNFSNVLRDAGKIEESKQILDNRPALSQKIEERSKRQEEKEKSYREALSASQTDAERIDVLDKLAKYLADEGRYGEAEGLFRQLVKLCTDVNGPQDRTVQRAMSQLALALRNQRKFDEVEEMYRNLLSIQKALILQ